MLSSRWQCSRCLGRYLRTAAKTSFTPRWQSTRKSQAQLNIQSLIRTVSINNAGDLVSPSLLERAKNIASEHAKLSLQNAEDYDVLVAKRIGELGPVTTALKEYEDAQNVCRRTLSTTHWY